jgi:hypothetical protein
MNTYRDSEGVTCQAFQLSGPTILITTFGEQCGEAGQWAVYTEANAGRPVLLPDTVFSAAFTLAE